MSGPNQQKLLHFLFSVSHVTFTFISNPISPRPGDLWFDSEHLELRVWYHTSTSHGYWVSTTHPGMRPDLENEPNPDALSVAVENAILNNFAEKVRIFNYCISNKNDDQIKDYNLKVTVKDYYFSNVIARASKTMHECNNSKLEKKLTGTDS